MTMADFSLIFSVLAVQLRHTDADEVSIRSYFKALQDLDVELVQMAAERMGHQGGSADVDSRHWFPKTSEWRALVAKIDRERTDELQARLRKLPAPICLACDDTGWARNEAANGVVRCGCASTRRLEVLWRRPMPALPAHEPEGEPGQIQRIQDLASQHVKGMR